MKKTLASSATALVILLSAAMTWGQASSLTLQDRMFQGLNFIKTVFADSYAPADWKAEYAQWNLHQQIDTATQVIQENPELSLREYQNLVYKFFTSTKDYHVGVSFTSTEYASLPFQVKSASDGKYYFVYIDRTKLPEASYPFAVGDELIEFADQEVQSTIDYLISKHGGNSELTDQALAELLLTRRSRARGMDVPQGPVTIAAKRGEQTIRRQLIWDYNPEKVMPPHLSNESTKSFSPQNLALKSTIDKQMVPANLDFLLNVADEDNEEKKEKEKNPHQIGAKESYVPVLGDVIWEADPESVYRAYIYKNKQNQLIGYIRIPSYVPEDADKAVAEFAEIMKKYETLADALVIDQVNNPGGSVFYLYALASTLTDQPLATPKHRMTISQSTVAEAFQYLPELEKVQTTEDLQKIVGKTISGFPITYEMARFFLEYYRFVIQEWNAGKTMTSPYYLFGVDHINPYPGANFTKPIVVLINELDFSGGDFFPAILQDNQRATLLGTRTAGAGGYVRSVGFPNLLGIAGFSLTGSIAERVTNDPIENLGVTPDIEYSLTKEDYGTAYEPYKKVINQTVSDSLK